jgi:hypothetical protein
MSAVRLGGGGDSHSWPVTVLSELQQYVALNHYLRGSLKQRLVSESWFENRVIRYVLQQSSWVTELDETFQAAHLDSVPNFGEIFDVRKGSAQDFDKRLFDALAEARLVAWARGQGYHQVQKLKVRAGHTTPDFRMERNGRICLAEARHFQPRDYLVYLVADRLEGLALETDALKQFSLSVEMGSKYAQKREDILKNRPRWVANTRRQLTEEAFLELLHALEATPNEQEAILDGLFLVERSGLISPGRVFPALMGMLDPRKTVEWCLSRLQEELLGKLGQIKGFIDATGAHADQAIVFFSGIDEWEPEWSIVWEALDANGGAAWKQLSAIKKAADQLIGIPFELIVGRYQKKGQGPNGEVQYGPIEYVPFSWQPESTS